VTRSTEIEQLKTQLQVLTMERDKLMDLVACMQDRYGMGIWNSI